MSSRVATALEVACPRCEAAAGEPCADLRSLHSGRHIPNFNPHPARVALAASGTPARPLSAADGEGR